MASKFSFQTMASRYNLRWLPMLGAAFLAMGVTMPSCPGQQAMQQQLDALNSQQSQVGNRLQTLERQVSGMSQDMAQSKQLVEQMAKVDR